MTLSDALQLILFLASLIAVTPMIGRYMTHVYEGRKIPGLSALEKLTYKVGGIDDKAEMSWKTYAKHS